MAKTKKTEQEPIKSRLSVGRPKIYIKEVVSTGSLRLDIQTGIGGLPLGRIIELYGKESTGKTTITCHVMAEIRKMGYHAAFIDAEHTFDWDYAESLGVDINNLRFGEPENGEEALTDVHSEIIESPKTGVRVIVVDSVAALTPKAEIDADFGSAQMGQHARLMGQAMRKLAGIAAKNNVLLIFLNQTREKIVMFGDPTTTTGGNALKFWATMRLHTFKTKPNKEDDVFISSPTRVKIEKNKIGNPYGEASFDIRFGEGIDKTKELIETAVDLEIIEKSGSYYNYGTSRLGQGMENSRESLINSPEIAAEILTKIKAHYPEIYK